MFPSKHCPLPILPFLRQPLFSAPILPFLGQPLFSASLPIFLIFLYPSSYTPFGEVLYLHLTKSDRGGTKF